MNPRYRLFYSHRSPFARRVRLALARLGLPYETVILNVFEPTEEFLRANPLGLVPVLEIDGKRNLPDSATILEYLHETHGSARPGAIWPADLALRLDVREASTWAEGLMTAIVAHFLETQRKEPAPSELAEHRANLERTLSRITEQNLSKAPWMMQSQVPTQAGWDLAVALEYLDLRIPDLNWRTRFPALKPLLESCKKAPEFEQTAPPPA